MQHAMHWVALDDARLGQWNGLCVALPTATPDAAMVADAVEYALGLLRGGRVALPGQAVPAGATHAIERDEAGRLRLVRRAFSKR